MNEGKAAAVTLLPQFDDPNLTYAPFTRDIIDKFLPRTYDKFPGSGDNTVVGRLLYSLAKAGLVNSERPPKFQFGSSRLAAYSKYASEKLLFPGEDPEIASAAKSMKQKFGDLDIDVQFAQGIKTKDIASFITQKFPFIKALPKAEAHLAVRYGNHVYQVDLINVQKEHESTELVFQFSSFKDLASEVKGAFQTELLKAVAAMRDSNVELQEMDKFSIDNPAHEFSIQYKKFIDCGYIPSNLRYKVAKLAKGIQLVVDFKNPSFKRGKSLACPLTNVLSYDDLDQIAKFLLDDDSVTGAIILSAVDLAKYVGDNFSPSKKQIIATIIQDNRAINRLDEEDRKKGLNIILQLLKLNSGISEQHWMQFMLPRTTTSFFKDKKLAYKQQKLNDNKTLTKILRKLQIKDSLSEKEKSIINSTLEEVGSGDPIFAIQQKIFMNQQAARAIRDTDFDFLNNRSSTYLNSRDFSYSMPGKARRKLPRTE
jgi:hypothetical protein